MSQLWNYKQTASPDVLATCLKSHTINFEGAIYTTFVPPSTINYWKSNGVLSLGVYSHNSPSTDLHV